MSKLTANAKTTKPTQIGGFCLFYAHINAQTPPQNAPFLALFAKNAKTEHANYNNINTLHFCILQFLQWMGVQTRQWLHDLKFFSFLRSLWCYEANLTKRYDICLAYHKLFLSLPSSHIYIPDSGIGWRSEFQEPPYKVSLPNRHYCPDESKSKSSCNPYGERRYCSPGNWAPMPSHENGPINPLNGVWWGP